MKTTIYQKFIARYGETFTLVNIDYDGDGELTEIVPHSIVSKLNQVEFIDLVTELMFWQNEKASWEE